MRRLSVICACGAVFAAASLHAQSQARCTASPELELERRTNSSAELLSAIGYWFIENNQPACAISTFEQAVRVKPNLLEARYNLGLLLAESGQSGKALEHLQAANKLNPQDKNIQAALASVSPQAKPRKPDVSPSITALNQSLALVKEKRYTEARNLLTQAVERDSQNPQLLAALGMTLTRMRLLDDAVKVFRQAIVLQPKSAEAQINLGVALADLSNQAEALKHFERATQISPQLAIAHYYQGRALHELRRETEAKSSLQQALRLQPDFPPALLTLGATFNRLGKYPQAVKLLQHSVQVDDGNPTSYFELGQALSGSGDAEGAIASYRRSLTIEPKNSQTAYALLQLLMQKKSPEVPALAAQVRELKRNELAITQARVLSNFGLDAANEKDWTQAVNKLRDALQACKSCAIRPALQKNLGLVLARSGELALARQELETARKLDPHDRDIEFAIELLSKGARQ